jgi:multiple sugar transport system ATP-binding protein
MKDGLVQQVGEPLTVYAKPRNRFVAGFIGSPAMNFIDCKVTGSDGSLAVDAPGGFLISIPAARRAALERYRGQSVILGVRPEDIREANASDPKDYRVEAVVEVVEPLGNEILIDVRIGSSPLVARVPPTSRLRMHERVQLSLDPERLHFFDTQTEQAID